MDENELRRKMQAGELAANNGTVMRTLAIGYLQVRCIEDKAPSSVSDAELEELEVKLTPRGIQLQRCVKKDPLVDM